VGVKSEQLFSVEGYAVIVTGGASGLGLAFTEALAENGATVTMLDVDVAGLAQESRRLQQLGYQVRAEVLDVRDHAALERAFDVSRKDGHARAEHRHGVVTCLATVPCVHRPKTVSSFCRIPS